MKTTMKAALAGASMLALAVPAYGQDGSTQTPPTQPGATTPDEGRAAEPEDAAGPADIIVTAQRRQERVTEVPISITVADQAQLERQQVNTVNDLNRIAPALEIQSAPAQNTGGGGSIRGVGTQTFAAGATASVGIVVDQVSQGNANIADLFDVARIEVLKGPQGTLFGLTTSAGVINITTNAPDPDGFSARVRGELSNAGTAGSRFGQQVVQGVVNIPVGPTSALRVSGLANLRQGTNRNLFTGKLNDVNRYGVRGRFLWEPTDDLSVNLIGDYSRGTSEGGGDFIVFTSVVPATAARLALCGVVAREGNRNFCTTRDVDARNRQYGGSLQVDYDTGPFTLTSITAARHSGLDQKLNSIYRVDPIITELLAGPTDNKTDLFTQEFRVSSPSGGFFEYTAGVFYSRSETTQQPEPFTITARPAPGVQIPIVNDRGRLNVVTDESLAVFGQGTFNVTDRLHLILGGRFTGGRLALDSTPAATGILSRQRLNTDVVSYRVGARYDVSNDTNVYATVNRGFKGGQIAIPTGGAPVVIQPEIPTSYEIGLKSTLFRSWVLDLNAFHQKIKNFQGQQCTVNPVTTQLFCVQTNISQVKSRGAEISLFGQVFENLSVNTGFIYAKTTYPGGFVGTDATDIGGTQLANAPRYKFTFSGEYEQPITDSFAAFLAADTVWKSRVRYEANSRRDTTFRPHWLVGGRLGVRDTENRYSLAVFARNLFDVHEPSTLLSGTANTPGTPPLNVSAIYGPQSFRQVGLQFDAKF